MDDLHTLTDEQLAQRLADVELCERALWAKEREATAARDEATKVWSAAYRERERLLDEQRIRAMLAERVTAVQA